MLSWRQVGQQRFNAINPVTTPGQKRYIESNPSETPVRTILLVLVLCATPVMAAPTCQTIHGDTIRCATPGAMPVHWSAPPEQWHPHTGRGSAGDLPQVLMVLALFFAMIALLPDFDGRNASDWDKQEEDESPR
jgi:hypothetical protein